MKPFTDACRSSHSFSERPSRAAAMSAALAPTASRDSIQCQQHACFYISSAGCCSSSSAHSRAVGTSVACKHTCAAAVGGSAVCRLSRQRLELQVGGHHLPQHRVLRVLEPASDIGRRSVGASKTSRRPTAPPAVHAHISWSNAASNTRTGPATLDMFAGPAQVQTCSGAAGYLSRD